MNRTSESWSGLVELEVNQPIWDRFFWLAPLVLVGTLEADGSHDLAPKHMAFPMGWQNWFGFVCTPRHHTYQNAVRHRVFTVSYPRPEQLIMTSLAASPRDDQQRKHVLSLFDVFPATVVEGVLVRGAYLYLECELERMIDGFGDNSLVVGRVVAARVDEQFVCDPDHDAQQALNANPLLAYIHPSRFAHVGRSHAFPFPAGMKK